MNKTDLFDRWHPYWDWECYQSGMWSDRRRSEIKVLEAAKILSSQEMCRKFMVDAMRNWTKSAEHHLSKRWINKRPWLGWAACCIAIGATEEETREAWNTRMTRESQDAANAAADEVIQMWEINYA